MMSRTGLAAVFLCVPATFIAGCATEQGAVRTADAVQASVIASAAGLSWTRRPASGLIVKIGNFDGTNNTFSWPPAVVASADQLPALDSCLDNLRMGVRLADPSMLAQPHFIESAAIHCFESSGMPAYVSTHEPDANEYDVQLSTGNLNESTPPEPGILLFASSGPYLGARRHIRTNTAHPPTVMNDVRDCRDRAVAEGIFTTTRMSDTPDSSGWQKTAGHTTIQPMVDRFDRCLRSRGYDVEAARN